MSTADLDAYWHDLFGAALVGTDRRSPALDPPAPIAELLVEVPPADAAAALIDQVAAAAALRRAGAAPVGPAALLQAPPADPRPEIPEVAVRRLAHVLDAWPVLEVQWLQAVVAGGWRLGPDTAVALLRRHRTTPPVRRIVEDAAGPLAAWLVDQMPGLAPARRPARADVEAPAAAPPLIGCPAELLAGLAGAPADLVPGFARWLRSHALSPADRAPLVAYVLHLPPGAVRGIAGVLAGYAAGAAGTMLAASLADLATTRHRMYLDLLPPGSSPSSPTGPPATAPALAPDPDGAP